MKVSRLTLALLAFWAIGAAPAAPAKLSAFHFNLVEMAKQRGITLEEAARAAQSWGITGVELWFGADESATGAGARLVAAGLKPVSVVLIQDFVHTNDVGRAERALAYARRVGAPHVMVVPGSCREGEDRAAAWRALRPNLEDFLRRATRAGIRVGIEAADPGNAVLRSRRDLREAFAALPTLGHVLDTGNCAPWNDDLLESIAEFRPRIRHVHVKDRSAEDFRKAVPAGTGTIPVREAVADLVRGGYDGWITVECFGSTNVWEDLSRSAAYVRRCASVR